MSITPGHYNIELAEKNLKECRNELFEYLNGFLAGKIKGAQLKKMLLPRLKTSMERQISFLPSEEQERLNKFYRNEFEILSRAIDDKNRLSDVITQESVSNLLNKNIVVEEQEDLKKDEQQIKDDNPEVSIYKQKEIIEENLEKLNNIENMYVNNFKDIEEFSLNDKIKFYSDLKEKSSEIADYFHNASTKRSLTDEEKSNFADRWHQALFLLNGINVCSSILEYEQLKNEIENLDVNDEQRKSEIESSINSLLENIKKSKDYFAKRYTFYSDKKNKEKIEKSVTNITKYSIINELLNIDSLEANISSKLLKKIEAQQHEKEFEDLPIIDEDLSVEETDYERNAEESTEFTEYPEDLSSEIMNVPLNDVPESEIDSEEIFETEEEPDIENTDPNANLDNEEYVDSLLELYEEEEEQPEISDTYVDAVIEELHTHIDEEIADGGGDTGPEAESKISSVSKRVNAMVSQKNISSEANIQKELEEIFDDMLSHRKKSFFKREKRKPYGDIDEDLFMDIRRVFTKINISSPYLDETSADDFAIEIFKDGIPQFSLGDMDESTNNKFLKGILKYTEMCEGETFTKKEKDVFEKFVLQPYKLRHMQKKGKDFISELEEDTFSQEDIIKNISEGDVKINKDIKKEKVK